MRSPVAAPGCRPLPHQQPHDYLCREPAVKGSPDLTRILALPRRAAFEADGRTHELIAAAAERWSLGHRPSCHCRSIWPQGECLTDFNAVQARILHEASVIGSICGPIGVGAGKTAAGIMAPMALADLGVQRSVILVPPRMQARLVIEHQLLAEHQLVPSLRCEAEDYAPTFPGRPLLIVLPYSRLSRPDFSTYLTNLGPDAIIADEAHRLRNPKAATTMRVQRYLEARAWVKFLWWTGTAEEGKLEDAAHLYRWALGASSPMPLLDEVTKDWGRAVNARRLCADPGALFALCEPGEHIRRAIRRRKADTLGVVATSTPSTDVRVTVEPMELGGRDIPPVITEALERVRDEWERPDGEELIDAMEVAAVARDLACGFYLYWIYPRGESAETIETWFAIRKLYRKEMRKKILRAEEELDSPALVERAAERYHGRRLGPGPQWDSEWWPEWDRVRATVQPETRVQWLSDFMVQDAARWARERRGVVWYWRSALGHAIATAADLPIYGAGADAGRALVQERGDRSVIVSAPAHGTGTDGLQYAFAECLLTQAPGKGQEQVIGRLARQGQKHPVRVRYYDHTDELREAHRWAVRRSRYALDAGDATLLGDGSGSSRISEDED
jgi:hypothetical protein